MVSAILARVRAPSLVLFPVTDTHISTIAAYVRRERLRGLLTANESACVHEDAAINPAGLGQLVVTEATPHLGQGLATFEALRRDRHSLHSPLTACLIRVKDVDRLLSIGNGELLLELKKMFLAK